MEIEKGNTNTENKFFKKMTFIMLLITTVAVVFIILNTITNGAKKKNTGFDSKNSQASSTVNVSLKEVDYETFVEELSMNAELKSLNGNVTILAPISGTLIKNNVRLGDWVDVGDVLAIIDASDVGVNYNQAPVYAKSAGTIITSNAIVNQKISAQSALYVIQPESDFVLSGYVSEKDASALYEGAEAYFTVAGDDETQHTGVLSYISPSVDSSTRRVAIEVDVDRTMANYAGLRNGNYVRLRIVKEELSDVFVVPNDAVKSYIGKDVVYTVDSNNIAHRVFVERSRTSETQSVISSGLKRGDKVVVQGTPSDGVAVQVL